MAERVHSSAVNVDEPVQQRLAALMYEVHDLLHRVLPPAAAAPAAGGS